jgi:hypothetical protein
MNISLNIAVSGTITHVIQMTPPVSDTVTKEALDAAVATVQAEIDTLKQGLPTAADLAAINAIAVQANALK